MTDRGKIGAYTSTNVQEDGTICGTASFHAAEDLFGLMWRGAEERQALLGVSEHFD